MDCPIYERARLRPGNVIPGPAIVEHMDAATVVLRGRRATVDAWGNLAIIHES